MPRLQSTITDYTFETFGDAIKRLNRFTEDGRLTEKELCGFIIQLFHEIPEEMYNDIVNND